jgi:hypothetical protein
MEKMKPGQISAKRAYEISDSLMDKSKKLKEFAYPQIRIGKATIKNKVADKQVSSSTSNPKTWGNTLSGRDRLNIGQKALKEASADSSKAVRLKNRADAAVAKAKATAGRDMPLPSSEGMMSKIANGLSTLFNK